MPNKPSNFPNGATVYGVPLMPDFAAGNVYFLDPSHANASDNNPGDTRDRPFATLAAAYAELSAGDTLYYIAGSTSLSLSAQLTWATSYTRFIGVCAPTRTAQRARIFQSSSATGLSPLINITGTGCEFRNLYIFQGVADATSLINVALTGGGRHYFENVHFAGGGHATQAINGGASLKLDSDTEENTFVNCTIGVDTIDAATGMVGLLLDGTSHRNWFENCLFRMRAGDTAAAFIEVADATGIDRDTTFKNCDFINNSTSNDMASAVVTNGTIGEPRTLQFINPYFYNVTTVNVGNQPIVFGNVGAITGDDLSGVAVELVS